MGVLKDEILKMVLQQDLAGLVYLRTELSSLSGPMFTHVLKLSKTMIPYVNKHTCEDDRNEWRTLEKAAPRDGGFAMSIGEIAFNDGEFWWFEATAYLWMSPWVNKDACNYVNVALKSMTSHLYKTAKVSGAGIGAGIGKKAQEVDVMQQIYKDVAEDSKKLKVAASKEAQQLIEDGNRQLSRKEKIKNSGLKAALIATVDENAKLAEVKQGMKEVKKKATVVKKKTKKVQPVKVEALVPWPEVKIDVCFWTSTYGKAAKVSIFQLAKLIANCLSLRSDDMCNLICKAMRKRGIIETASDTPASYQPTKRYKKLMEATTYSRKDISNPMLPFTEKDIQAALRCKKKAVQLMDLIMQDIAPTIKHKVLLQKTEA